MKIKTDRKGEFVDSNYLVVTIDENKYRISEDANGNLCITKLKGGDETISIKPSYANQISID